MSKKKKRTKERGPTFVGLAPIYEKTKRERIESGYKKHKNRQIDPDFQKSGSLDVVRLRNKVKSACIFLKDMVQYILSRGDARQRQ